MVETGNSRMMEQYGIWFLALSVLLNSILPTPADPRKTVDEEDDEFLNVFSKQASDIVSAHSKHDHRHDLESIPRFAGSSGRRAGLGSVK